MRDRIDRVAEHHEQAMGELFRPDGSKFYSDDEHTARAAELKREFNANIDAIEDDIAQRIASTEEELLKLEHADPTDILTNEELERANVKRAFVADDCFNLPLKQLEQRCRAALASGDRATMFLYAHHAAQRVGEPKGYDPNNPRSGDEEGSREVREVVAELEKKLAPERESKLERAREELSEAQELKRYAYYRRRGAKNAAELYLNQRYGNVGDRLARR
jgi:hypothetical protein